MKFEGIMPALVTPLNEDETINVKVLQDLIEYQLAHGADGFYVGGATGEGLALKTEQRFILAEESVKAINKSAFSTPASSRTSQSAQLPHTPITSYMLVTSVIISVDLSITVTS